MLFELFMLIFSFLRPK